MTPSNFRQHIESHEAKVGVIGLGYVGLPLVREFAGCGIDTVGFDIDAAKVEKLRAGESYIKHIPAETIRKLRDDGHFEATTDFERIAEVDAILICVPTPLTQQREPDLSYVRSTCEAIAPHLRAGQIVILESTTYPGTTDEVMRPILEQGGLKADEDFFLAYSPERENPGDPDFTTSRIPKVVGADNDEARDRACALYEQIVCQVVPVSSLRTAEAVKITENIFRCVNIAMVNELKLIYSRMDIDVWEVIDAAKTKPFGFMPFYPGPGLGGHCIPIDPFYLTWKAREFECSTRFVELAGEINTTMPEHVIGELMNALNDHGKALKGARVLVIGLAYKKDVDDLRESPTLKLFELLHRKGADFSYHDPFIPSIMRTREYPQFAGMQSVDLTPESLADYDAVLISTDHSSIDYAGLVRDSKLVVDTRNATRDVAEGREKIVKA